MEQNFNVPDFAHIFELKALEEKITNSVEEKKRNNQNIKEGKFSHYVQMLILDYLGVGKNLRTNVEKAEIYAPLIRRDIKTTAQYFSSLNCQKNEKNLKIIYDFFKKAGFPDLAQSVQNDINRYIKRKY